MDKIDTSQHLALKNRMDAENINDILSIMYPFILFKLHDQNPKQRYTMRLCIIYSTAMTFIVVLFQVTRLSARLLSVETFSTSRRPDHQSNHS